MTAGPGNVYVSRDPVAVNDPFFREKMATIFSSVKEVPTSMSPAFERNLLLSEFVRYKIEEARKNRSETCFFGFETSGSYIHKYHMDFEWLSYLFNPYGAETISSSWVRIYVPRTPDGVAPLTETEQPYGWDGKINSYSAEMAVWWAFELLTNREGLDFLTEHQPVVVFEYVLERRFYRLRVQYRDGDWFVNDEE